MTDILHLFKILADKNRLRIIGLLSIRKMCVCELAYVLEVTQPSVSRHLKRMKKAGLIDSEQDGFWSNYFLTPSSGITQSIMSIVIAQLNTNPNFANDLNKLEGVDRETICQ